MFGPSGFWTMAPLHYAAEFDPFLSLDRDPTPSTLAQSKERKGSNFAIWQPWELGRKKKGRTRWPSTLTPLHREVCSFVRSPAVPPFSTATANLQKVSRCDRRDHHSCPPKEEEDDLSEPRHLELKRKSSEVKK